MIALIGYWLALIKKKENLLIFPLTFLIISAISNIIDRIRYGAVIDYFDLKYFTIFNLSDVIIVLATMSLQFFIIRKGDLHGKG
jgi:signal peptidase II